MDSLPGPPAGRLSLLYNVGEVGTTVLLVDAPPRSNSMIHLYLETNIWNAVCKQGVDAEGLLKSLAEKNATLVISPHTVYQLARTFTGKKPAPKAQGTKLFSCVKAFLDLSIPCSKELMEFLSDEVQAY